MRGISLSAIQSGCLQLHHPLQDDLVPSARAVRIGKVPSRLEQCHHGITVVFPEFRKGIRYEGGDVPLVSEFDNKRPSVRLERVQ